MTRWRDIKKGKIQAPKKNDSSEKIIRNTLLTVRFKAFITDSFMLLIPLMYIVFYFIMGSRENFAEDKISGWLYIFIPHFIIVISFWHFKAQTPGMKAYEIELVNDIQIDKKPSVLQLFIRYISMTFFMFLVIPIFYPYFNKNNKTLWDICSKTYIKLLNSKY